MAIDGLDWTTRHYAPAFDLTVEGLHTYYVGNGDQYVLVHNTDCVPGSAQNGTQLTLFDADDYIAPGVRRAAEHGGNWQRASLGDAVSRHVGTNPVLSYSGQKAVLTGRNGTEVIIDSAGGYFRIRDVKGTYLMLDGSPVPANVPVLRPGGTSVMSGVPRDLRQALTHFWIE